MPLHRLLGTWTFQMQHAALPQPVTGRQRFELVLGGAFVLLDWRYEHPDFPDALALLDTSSLHYFDVRGVTRLFDLEIDDAGWRMIRRDEDFWQRSTTRFVGPEAMAGVGENSHDEGTSWELDYTIDYSRSR